VLASLHAQLAAFDAKRLMQGDGLEVFNGHLSREGDDVVELVYFAHRVVEDAGDNAAMRVAGRSGIALAEAKLADEGLAGFVEDEFQAHAFGIVHAADEAIVFLHFCVTGVVAVDLGLAWHGDDFNLTGAGAVLRKSICRRWQVAWVLRWKTCAEAQRSSLPQDDKGASQFLQNAVYISVLETLHWSAHETESTSW
jgi:hypothetical protein